VIGNAEKLEAASFLPSNDTPVAVNDIMSVRETAPHLIAGFEGRARAFVQVQNGCDHRCTFCIIPYGRGNSRSVPLGEIVNQARTLVEAGYQELVLTGVDLSAYGRRASVKRCDVFWRRCRNWRGFVSRPSIRRKSTTISSG